MVCIEVIDSITLIMEKDYQIDTNMSIQSPLPPTYKLALIDLLNQVFPIPIFSI